MSGVKTENPQYGELLQKVAQMRVLRGQLRGRFVQAHSKANFLRTIENSSSREQMRVGYELFFLNLYPLTAFLNF